MGHLVSMSVIVCLCSIPRCDVEDAELELGTFPWLGAIVIAVL